VCERGAETAVAADSGVVPLARMREPELRIRELERALGRKTLEMEILRVARARAGRLAGRPEAPSRHTRLKWSRLA
jgi:hypothetical protein